MGAQELRPGLRYFPDAADYDETMAQLERELGRKPTIADIIDEIRIGAALLYMGTPCAGCGGTDAPIAGSYVPDLEVVELVGYALCKPCGERFDADSTFRETLNAKLMEQIVAERAA